LRCANQMLLPADGASRLRQRRRLRVQPSPQVDLLLTHSVMLLYPTSKLIHSVTTSFKLEPTYS